MRPFFEEFEAFQINISTNKIDDYEVSYGFYSNGNNECNRNELGRQLINQHDALWSSVGKETLAFAITMRDLILGASPLTNKFKAFHKIKNTN